MRIRATLAAVMAAAALCGSGAYAATPAPALSNFLRFCVATNAVQDRVAAAARADGWAPFSANSQRNIIMPGLFLSLGTLSIFVDEKPDADGVLFFSEGYSDPGVDMLVGGQTCGVLVRRRLDPATESATILALMSAVGDPGEKPATSAKYSYTYYEDEHGRHTSRPISAEAMSKGYLVTAWAEQLSGSYRFFFWAMPIGRVR